MGGAWHGMIDGRVTWVGEGRYGLCGGCVSQRKSLALHVTHSLAHSPALQSVIIFDT